MKNLILLSITLGSQDIKQAYRRSALGAFWITGAMALQIATITLVFGLLFKNPLSEYLPFVATSIIVWGFISNSLNDGCQSFIVGEGIIKQLKIRPIVHILRTYWKNLLTLAHNLAILPVAFLLVLKGVTPSIFLVIPGFLLLSVNMLWMMVLLGFLSARFRDIPPLVSSTLMILLNVTPVFWYPKTLGDASLGHLLLGLNPFYHLIQVSRLPILGQSPTPENWLIAFSFAVTGWLVAGLVIKSYSHRLAYWV